MGKTNSKNQQKLLNAVRQVPTIAQKEGWVMTLDRDEGTLFYSPKVIPDKSELFQVTDEYALYLDKSGKPRGVMVEYYGVNFIKHHPEFQDMTEDIFKGKNDIKIVDASKKQKNKRILEFKALFERTLIAEAFVGVVAAH